MYPIFAKSSTDRAGCPDPTINNGKELKNWIRTGLFFDFPPVLNKYKLIWLLMILPLQGLWSQEILHREVPEFGIRESDGRYKLHLENSFFAKPGDLVPVYRELVPVSSPGAEIRVEPASTSVMDPGVLMILPLEDELPQGFQYQARPVTIRGRDYLEIQFCPLSVLFST